MYELSPNPESDEFARALAYSSTNKPGHIAFLLGVKQQHLSVVHLLLQIFFFEVELLDVC